MTDPTTKEGRERLRAGAEMAAAHGFDVTVSGNTLLSLVDAAAERDALRERVAELEAREMQARGRVSRLKALIAQAAAGAARGEPLKGPALIARMDAILATEAAPEDFVRATVGTPGRDERSGR